MSEFKKKEQTESKRRFKEKKYKNVLLGKSDFNQYLVILYEVINVLNVSKIEKIILKK